MFAEGKSWKQHGRCANDKTIQFYLKQGIDLYYGEGSTSERLYAKKLCNSCPVRQLCSETGHTEPYGHWGGYQAKRDYAKPELTPEEAQKKALAAAMRAQEQLMALLQSPTAS